MIGKKLSVLPLMKFLEENLSKSEHDGLVNNFFSNMHVFSAFFFTDLWLRDYPILPGTSHKVGARLDLQ